MRKTKILSVFLAVMLFFPSYSVFAVEGEDGNMTPKSESTEANLSPETYSNTSHQKTTTDNDASTIKVDTTKEEVVTKEEPKPEPVPSPTISTQSEIAESERSVESKQNDMRQPWWIFIIAAATVLVLAQFINSNKKAKV